MISLPCMGRGWGEVKRMSGTVVKIVGNQGACSIFLSGVQVQWAHVYHIVHSQVIHVNFEITK